MNFDIPAEDFGLYEVNDTLLLRTVRASHKMWVTARFNVYGALSEVMYVFVWDGLGWRIDDFAGPNGAAPHMCQNDGTVDGIAFPAWAQVDCFEWND